MGKPANLAIKKPGFVHSAIWLAGCVAVAALLLLPIALGKSGTGSPWGLLAAAGICLLASLASEAIASALVGPNLALQRLALGMGARMLPPLAICCFLALQGQNGRQHLAFVCYLLAFYLVTLTVDTLLAIRRIAGPPMNRKTLAS